MDATILASVMLIYAGIDEAGYGPVIGPLCVACTTFLLPEYDPADGAPNLWSVLRHALSRAGRDKRGRIAIDDSKKLKGPNTGPTHPLWRLERGVLAFLGDDCPADDETLLDRFGSRTPSTGWYHLSNALPVAISEEELQVAVSRLIRHLSRTGIEFRGFDCETIDAGQFNEGVSRFGSKAMVNFHAVLRLINRVWERWPREHPRIIIDRQGGRTQYLALLQEAWPDAAIEPLAESNEFSRYRLVRRDSSLTLTFLIDADCKHLPVSLASMAAKYVRELMMLRINRFFHSHLPELKPTAGYYKDERRYVREIEGLLPRLKIERKALVRVQ